LEDEGEFRQCLANLQQRYHCKDSDDSRLIGYWLQSSLEFQYAPPSASNLPIRNIFLRHWDDDRDRLYSELEYWGGGHDYAADFDRAAEQRREAETPTEREKRLKGTAVSSHIAVVRSALRDLYRREEEERGKKEVAAAERR
jgi:hypothetical protein